MPLRNISMFCFVFEITTVTVNEEIFFSDQRKFSAKFFFFFFSELNDFILVKFLLFPQKSSLREIVKI
jgi:hypothetical protein